MSRTVVFGIGHPDRGDDAAGLLVADLLKDTPHVTTRCVEGDPTSILTDPLWDTADHVVLVDTVRTGAPAGTVFTWDAAEVLDLLAGPGGGTHDLGVGTTVRLARALARLPRDLTLIGIEGAAFEPGRPPSHEVLAAAQRVAAALDVRVLTDTGGGLVLPG